MADVDKALIEQHGGKNTGSISAKTSFILAGENMGPAKLEKAQKLGIPVVNEDEFLKMIGAWYSFVDKIFGERLLISVEARACMQL